MFVENQQIGSYMLIRRLGKGGFGEVWLAEKRSHFVTKKVAVKLPLGDQIDFDTIRNEAVLWEEASGHPNVLPIIDADVYDSQVVIVSEFASGGSLADKIRIEGRLSLRDALEITIGVLSGLDYLHRKQIIHRDIKPQNILMQDGTPRLADFGISRAMNTASVSATVSGTDSYMAPEAFEGKRNVQTDIWSVGVVLYQLLQGTLPFPQPHPTEKMFAILQRDFEPLSSEIPGDLRAIVRRAMEKDPTMRYQSALAMKADLEGALIRVKHPGITDPEVSRETSDKKNKIEEERRRKRKTIYAVVAAAMSMALLLGIIGTFGLYKIIKSRLDPGASNASKTAMQALDAIMRGDSIEAKKLAADALGVDKDLPLALAVQGYARTELGNRTEEYEDGRKDLERAAALEPNNALFQAWLIETYVDLNLPPMAEKAAHRAVSILDEPSSATDFYSRAEAEFQLKQFDLAIRDYSKAAEINPQYAMTFIERAAVYRDQKDYELAIRDYSEALKINPQFADAYNGRAEVYSGQKNFQSAIEDETKAIGINPQYAAYYYERGYASFKTSDYDASLRDYDRAIQLNPNYALAYYERGFAYFDQKNYDAALRDYNRAIEINPRYSAAYYERGLTHEKQKDYDAAMRDYSRSIELDPQLAVAYYNRGFLYNEKKNYEEAIRDFNRVIEIDPQNAGAYSERSYANEKLGRKALASADRQKYKELSGK